MKVLLLGAGMQGKAALYDLVRSGKVTEVIVADKDVDSLKRHVAAMKYGPLVRCEFVDGSDPRSIERLMATAPDVVIDLTPTTCHLNVATAAVAHRAHVVNASYATPELTQLGEKAKNSGLTLLFEFGMDPGIDLVLLGEAVRTLDEVEEIISYGSGFPEPSAANNALRYKVTWTLEGVLKSYYRAGRVIREGRVIDIPPASMFNPEHVHELYVEGLGRLEAFPNGDALKYVDLLGLDRSRVREAGRYVLRWPGHCAIWKAVNDLHLLDDGPVTVDGLSIDRKRFLAAIVEPHLQYARDERDIAHIRVVAGGARAGKKWRNLFEIIDRRDLDTGFTAMNRTVGFTTSIGALMIGDGRISRRGVATPLKDVPFDEFLGELRQRGITVRSEHTECR